MPGTIHVSVLELVGLPYPPQSSSSSMGVKVSMGKQAHEIQDKKEASFTVASLRDNLNVSIHDSQGNEIARTDVETRSIVEKGTWDDLFPLKGGGKIRLKLHFYLTEDEQNRIRRMREYAARKKQDSLLTRSHSSSGLARSTVGSSVSFQDSLKSQEGSNLDTSFFESNVKDLNKAQPGQKNKVFSTSKSTEELDMMATYHELKERLDKEQQNQLDIRPSNEEAQATNKSSSTTQLGRTTVDEVPSLKKKVTLDPKPVLPKLEASLNPLLSEQLERERGTHLPANDKPKEEAKLSSTQVDTPSNPPVLKPIFVKSKPATSSLVKDELRKEREKVETPSITPASKKINPIKSKPVLSTTPIFSMSDEIGKELGKILPVTSETRETLQSSSSTTNKEEILSQERLQTFSLKTLLESLPIRKKLLTDKFKEKQGFNNTNPFLVEKKWRSKHWRSYQHIAKSKVFDGNKNYLIDSFRGWLFLEEMMYPCLLRDNRPFVYPLEGCISDSSPELDDQEKLGDTGVTHRKCEKGWTGSKKEESTIRPDTIPFSAPIGQVMKIAIMVGFGLLVIFTRRSK